MEKPVLDILYDGDCPFCRSYFTVLRIKENFTCRLINARERPDLVTKYRDQGYEIAEGFIVTIDDQIYHGADALTVLSTLSSSSGALNRMMATVFRSPRLAKFSYPFMKAGRGVTLRLLGRSPNF